MQYTINWDDFAHMNLGMVHNRADPLSIVRPGLILYLKTGTAAKSALPAFSRGTGFDGNKSTCWTPAPYCRVSVCP